MLRKETKKKKEKDSCPGSFLSDREMEGEGKKPTHEAKTHTDAVVIISW